MYPMPKARARAAGRYGAQLAEVRARAARSGNAAGPTNAVPKHTNAPCDTCISYRYNQKRKIAKSWGPPSNLGKA